MRSQDVAAGAGDRSGASTRPVRRHEERLLVDGVLRPAAGGATFEVVAPATGRVAGRVGDGDADDMSAAVAAARRAFDESGWATDRPLRRRCLEQLQDGLEAEREEFREELIVEVGTPRMLTYGAQLDGPLEDALRWPAEEIDRYPWERRLAATEHASERWVLKEPVGVVAALNAWNFPFQILLGKLGVALATGNTVVVKPPPQTPWNATRIGRLIAEATDIPAGVVNVVPTQDQDISRQLFTDPRVDMISFTGSTATGQLIQSLAAPTLKRVVLELGGKSAAVVLDDADLAAAVQFGAGACAHAGQGCALPTRMLVQRGVYDQVVSGLEQVFRALPMGDPDDPSVLVGPVVSARQRDRILELVRRAPGEGARLVVGGRSPDREGFWVEPTLFADVDNASTIAQEEVFGPVLVVTPFDTDADAVRLANASRYGLSGSVFSRSPDRALAVARGVRAGTFMVNGGRFDGADAPFGGYKSSGIGRVGGVEGFEAHLQTKVVGTTTPLPIHRSPD